MKPAYKKQTKFHYVKVVPCVMIRHDISKFKNLIFLKYIHKIICLTNTCVDTLLGTEDKERKECSTVVPFFKESRTDMLHICIFI